MANRITVMAVGDLAPNFGAESVIVKAYIEPKSKRLSSFTVIPMLVPTDTMEPYLVPVNKARSFIAKVERLSRKYGTRFKVDSGGIVVLPVKA
jgi:hypothetical protein